MSLLLVEQYVKRALELADYVYLINRGTITFSGPCADLDSDEVLRSYLGG
jgi:branched-chain amino acid transport system ATP-binding protein